MGEEKVPFNEFQYTSFQTIALRRNRPIGAIIQIAINNFIEQENKAYESFKHILDYRDEQIKNLKSELQNERTTTAPASKRKNRKRETYR